MLQRDKEGRFAPGGHVTSGCFSGTVISVLNKVKGGSGAGLCPAPAPAPNPMLLGWTTGEATLPGNLDVLRAGLGCRLTFSRSGCRDGQQLKIRHGRWQAWPSGCQPHPAVVFVGCVATPKPPQRFCAPGPPARCVWPVDPTPKRDPSPGRLKCAPASSVVRVSTPRCDAPRQHTTAGRSPALPPLPAAKGWRLRASRRYAGPRSSVQFWPGVRLLSSC